MLNSELCMRSKHKPNWRKHSCSTLRQFCEVICAHTGSRRSRLKAFITLLHVFELSKYYCKHAPHTETLSLLLSERLISVIGISSKKGQQDREVIMGQFLNVVSNY